MAGLLYKEYLQNRAALRTLAIGFGFFSLLLCLPINETEFSDDSGGNIVYFILLSLVTVVMFLITGAMQQGLFEPDERHKWADFIASTPISVRGQVLSKYYFALLMTIGSMVYIELLLAVNTLIQGQDVGAANVLPVLASIQLVMRSVEFPFLIRFGSRHSNSYRIAIFFTIMAVVFIYLMFGDLTIFGSFDTFMEKAAAFMQSGKQETVLLYGMGLLPIVAGVLYYLSYRFSCRLFWKGVACYDK